MARRESAGILLYSFKDDDRRKLRVLIGHMGGPFHANKDDGHWGIPKGEVEAGENPFDTACREFEEETGMKLESLDDPIDLGDVRQKGGKYVRAWALPGTYREDPPCRSNTFPLEWPPRSGKFIDVPEMDRLLWVSRKKALKKMRPAQFPFVDRLREALAATDDP